MGDEQTGEQTGERTGDIDDTPLLTGCVSEKRDAPAPRRERPMSRDSRPPWPAAVQAPRTRCKACASASNSTGTTSVLGGPEP
jgi:hypothetical protein